MMPEVGKVYHLAEPDYAYGTGPLAVRVLKIVRPVEMYGEPWWEVEAVAKIPSYVGPGREWTLFLRAAALRSAERTQ
jgi:hypothetical protein